MNWQISWRQLGLKIARAALRLSAISALCLPLLASHLPTTLEQLHAAGELHVVSRNGPTTYYEGPDGITGLEYDLVKAFADELGLELIIHEEENLSRLLTKAATSQVHIAAAGITVTDERRQLVRFSQPYRAVNELLIYNRRNEKPTELEDLIGKDILVMSGSSHVQTLRELQLSRPQIQWAEHPEAEMIDLIEMVHTGEIDYTVVDSNAYAMSQKIYPRAAVAMELSASQQLAWAFPKSVDDSLFERAQSFFTRLRTGDRLEQLITAYDNPVDLDQGGAITIAGRIESRLPRWEDYMKQAGETYNLDWQLLAAMSYQESHWNEKAKSYTGVRGLMMLTKATALEMGIEDRVDPVQSIYGGAKYFKRIFDRLPERIQGDDRTWMALAAYNVGFGHLEDARVLTEHLGDDPNRWQDVKEHLPKLAKRKYYRSLKHGYARGWEPVKYVENIQRYYTVLAWHNTFNNPAVYAAQQDPHSGVRPVKFQNNSGDVLAPPVL